MPTAPSSDEIVPMEHPMHLQKMGVRNDGMTFRLLVRVRVGTSRWGILQMSEESETEDAMASLRECRAVLRGFRTLELTSTPAREP